MEKYFFMNEKNNKIFTMTTFQMSKILNCPIKRVNECLEELKNVGLIQEKNTKNNMKVLVLTEPKDI